VNPAFSVVFFTTLAGSAQGLVVALALAALAGLSVGTGFSAALLAVAAVMLAAGLGCSFLHLGRPERAWRAATMWRTSWLSREVIVLPAFIAVVALWYAALQAGAAPLWTRLALPLAALVLAALLWLCTAMIYACLRFIEEWAHPLTLANFVLAGLSSGFLLATALARLGGEDALARACGPAALAATLLAWALRAAAVRRNAGIRHRSTLQSATGIAAPRLAQMSMGMSAGSFNTREFFHRASALGLRRIRLALFLLGFALPAALAVLALLTASPPIWIAAAAVQAPGLIADRWFFFAQAKHPQNLYYQTVS
jgi:sulfite dehydrogenase (quinone) subunit SoeC